MYGESSEVSDDYEENDGQNCVEKEKNNVD